MTHEKIIKRENGDSVLIKVTFSAEYFRNEFDYRHDVAKRAKGKRNWHYINPDEISDYIVSNKEILQAKLELWEKMKPM